MAVGGFLVLFVAIVWLGLRQGVALDVWIDRRVKKEGWVVDPADSPVSPERSRWLAMNTLTVGRVAVNPRPGLLEAAFILARPPFRGMQGGLGIVARLPRPVPAPVVFVPVPAVARSAWSWLTGVELPEVPIGDERLAPTWTAFSDRPDAAAQMLAAEPRLADALMEIAARVLGHAGHAPRASFVVVELTGGRAYLFAGPRAINQEPFPALEEAAELIAAALPR